jgi:hypothetical protein
MRCWDPKIHGKTMLIVACVLACIGMGLISEILILLSALRLFKQVRQEKKFC